MATLTRQTNNSSSADAATYTMNALGIGTASADRWVVFVVGANSNTSSAISGVTVNGVAATEVAAAFAVAAPNSASLKIYEILVTTGTTADFVISIGGGQRAFIDIWTLTGRASVFDTGNDSDGSDPQTFTIDIPQGGHALFGCFAGGTTGGSVTWTNATEDADTNVESRNYSIAHNSPGSFQSNITITSDFAGATTNPISVGASWAIISEGVGAASGTGDTSGIGSSTAEAVAAASGVGASAVVGTGINEAVGASAGAGASVVVGTAVWPGVGAASGVGDSAVVGHAIFSGVGVASGAGAAAAVPPKERKMALTVV